MTKKRKIALVLLYASIIAAMLFMFIYVQKRYRHDPSKKHAAVIGMVTLFDFTPERRHVIL